MKQITISIFQKVLHEATRRRGICAELSYTDANGKEHTKQLRRAITGTPLQAEATGILMALAALREPCAVRIVTGNAAIANQTPESRTLNPEFWRAIDAAATGHEISWHLLAPARPRYPEAVAS